ncbi:MAG: restriction endonuclease subunit S, partial [Bacteroidaceae bacterium]
TRGLNPDVPLKDSGIEWIGDIPEHWEVRKNKFIFKERNLIVGNKSQDYTLLSLTLEGIKKRNLNVLQGKFPASFNTYKEVHSGDLVFCLFDMDETPRTIGLSKIKGMITGAYTIIIPRSNVTSHYYYYYYYLNIDYEKKLKPLYRGLRKSVSIGAFMDYKLPLPPLSEQKKIAAYLEEVDKETNRLIELNHRAIDKLKEYKQVLIDQAVRGEICLV